MLIATDHTAYDYNLVDRPDVVFLDLVMTGMYGLDVLTSYVRSIRGTRHRRVGRCAESSHEMVHAGGAVGFLDKPVNRRDGRQCCAVRSKG